MRIYYNNLISSATLVASTTKTNYPLSNLIIPQLARRFSFVGNSGNIVIDFGEDKEIGACIVDTGNLTSGATITLQGNDSDSWTSPNYSQALTFVDSCFYLNLSEEYRYWRLVVSDSSVVDAELGYLYLGDAYLQLPTLDPGVEFYYNTTSVASLSLSGQVYGDEGYQYLETTFTFPQIAEFNQTIKDLSVAKRKDILDMWDTVQNIVPIWVILYENNLDEYSPVFCIINSSGLKFKKLSYGKYYSFDLPLRQVW